MLFRSEEEAKNILNKGGYISRKKVLGSLAATRSLGDPKLRKWAVGTPFTNGTELSDKHELVILASDGVSYYPGPQQAVLSRLTHFAPLS